MSGLTARIRSLWRGVRRRRDVEVEMLEEFRHHIELRAADLVRQGVPAAEAQRHARVEFGHVESHREAARASRGLRLLDEIGFSWLDMKLGLRMIRKYPGLSLVSVIGMAVAIAIGAGFFGFSDAVMDPTLPVSEGDRVVSLQNATDDPGTPERRMLHDFVLWRDEMTSVRDLAAFRTVRRNVTTDAGTDLTPIAEMSAAGFRVPRVAPLMGRPLLEEDERPGGPRVIVIAEEEWRQRFAADPEIVGRTLRVAGTPHTIVGVMPAGFRFPLNNRYWLPLRLDPSDYEVGGGPTLAVFGRLADGATLERAQAELATLGARMAAEYPDTHARLRPQVLSYTRDFFDVDSPAIAWAMRLLQVGISLLLVVVAVNVATLVYARTATRIGEIAVRSALGASRRRIVAQLFGEAFIVSAVAAVIGLGIAVFALAQLQAHIERNVGSELPYWFELGLSPGLIAYVAVLALLAGMIVGVVPALRATGRRMQAGLQQLAARGSSMQLGRTWTAMIVAQVAIAVAVLPFAVYIAGQSLVRATAEARYRTEEILHARLTLERDDATPAALAASYDSLMDARFVERAGALLRSLEGEPAVAGVAFSRRAPSKGISARFELDDGSTMFVLANNVDLDMFDVLGVPIVAGRGFDARDTRGGPRAVVVSRTFADRLGGMALGRRIRQVWYTGTDDEREIEYGPWLDVIGVVPDFAIPDDFDPEPPRLYTPPALGVTDIILTLRIRDGNPAAFVSRLHEITASVDPDLQLSEVTTAADGHRAARHVLLAMALAVLAVTSSVLLLSAAGIYAMMSFTVARRRREIGIRSALGAEPRRLLAGIFARAAAQLGTGVAAGLLLAFALDRAMGGGPFVADGLVYLPIVAATILALGLFAALGPARRALAVQPTEALREE